MSVSLPELKTNGINVLFTTITLVGQTLFYGIYAVLIPFSSHILLKKGLKTRTDLFMFCTILVLFFLSSAYWVMEVANLLSRLEGFFIHPSAQAQVSGYLPGLAKYSSLGNALILINFIFSDGVVVWRAWVICHGGYHKALLFSAVLYAITIVSILTTIGIRISTFIAPSTGGPLTSAINICQISNFAFSLFTNVSATSVISHKAWLHRRALQEALKRQRGKSTQAERILALLVESGFLYCVSGLAVMIAAVIRLPHGTLGDIYIPTSVQIAGIYPTIVVVLVSLQWTINDTAFDQTQLSSTTATSAEVSRIRFRVAAGNSFASDDERHQRPSADGGDLAKRWQDDDILDIK